MPTDPYALASMVGLVGMADGERATENQTSKSHPLSPVRLSSCPGTPEFGHVH